MNFGWILIGSENKSQTAMRFVSRDPLCNGEPTGLPHPLLEVTYSLPDEE
jgi:hypothetical protein